MLALDFETGELDVLVSMLSTASNISGRLSVNPVSGLPQKLRRVAAALLHSLSMLDGRKLKVECESCAIVRIFFA